MRQNEAHQYDEMKESNLVENLIYRLENKP